MRQLSGDCTVRFRGERLRIESERDGSSRDLVLGIQNAVGVESALGCANQVSETDERPECERIVVWVCERPGQPLVHRHIER